MGKMNRSRNRGKFKEVCVVNTAENSIITPTIHHAISREQANSAGRPRTIHVGPFDTVTVNGTLTTNNTTIPSTSDQGETEEKDQSMTDESTAVLSTPASFKSSSSSSSSSASASTSTPLVSLSRLAPPVLSTPPASAPTFIPTSSTPLSTPLPGSISTPRSVPLSGRVWKSVEKTRSSGMSVRVSTTLRSSWREKMKRKEKEKEIKMKSKELKEAAAGERQKEKEIQEQKKKMKEENEKKGRVVQVIKDTKKIKKMNKKQLQSIEKA